MRKPTESVTATVFGAVLLLIGATSVFGELQDALDRIWRAPVRDRSGGVWGLVRARLLSFGMILGIAFLLMVSLVLSAAIAALGKWWSGAFGGWEILARLVDLAIGFVLTTGVFAMIYKVMPRVSVQWHDVWLGAAVTSVLFTVGRFLIGLYIGKTGIASGFGAAGSLIVVFVWVYYSAQIFLIGAEFTWIYAKTFGSMRALAGPADAKSTAEIPTSNSDEPPVVALPVVSPLLPSAPSSAASTPNISEFGLGIAAGFALRSILPRLAGIVIARATGRPRAFQARPPRQRR